jgi:hypothetical protein
MVTLPDYEYLWKTNPLDTELFCRRRWRKILLMEELKKSVIKGRETGDILRVMVAVIV